MSKIYKFISNNGWDGDINDERLSFISNNLEEMEAMKEEILHEAAEYPYGSIDIVPIKGALVIMNETHSLLQEQHKLLYKEFYEKYGMYSILTVPAKGWTIEEMKEIISSIGETASISNPITVIFVSPIPYMIMELTRREIFAPATEYCESTGLFVRTFHNDHREKKELPNGRVMQVVAKEGWQLV